jgi:hypothetical protein
MDVLYRGERPPDPTRASIPWHLAANGSVEAGQSAGIVQWRCKRRRGACRSDELAGIDPAWELIAGHGLLPVFV